MEISNYEADARHKKVTSMVLEDFARKDFKTMEENIMRAGSMRGFLG